MMFTYEQISVGFFDSVSKRDEDTGKPGCFDLRVDDK